MSDTEYLDNPLAVLRSVQTLLAEPTAGTEPLPLSGPSSQQVTTTGTKIEASKDKRKGKFVPRGEGASGLSHVPPLQVPIEPRQEPAPMVISSEQQVLDLLSTPPGEEVDASYVDVPHFSDLPPAGETATPVRHDEETEVWATKSEVQEIVETLDEFIKMEIQEALSPVLRDLKVISADIKALSGASSALIQKMSSLQTKVLNLEKIKPATITSSSHIAVAPVKQSTIADGPSGGSGNPSASTSAPLSPVARFLQSYPTFIETGILRKVRLTELAREMGHKGPLPAVGKVDWNESKLTQKFSSHR